jgi:tetrahydromethanopterin S-methyltransferase subunit A
MANLFEKIAGKICEVAFPIKHDIFYGNENSSVAICTLSSIDLLEQISRSDLMSKVAVAARLFSENMGIETMIRHVLQHGKIRHIILCGKDTKGHLPGQALLALQANGVDNTGRIVGAKGKYPVLELTKNEINQFRDHVIVIDMIGVNQIDGIVKQIEKLIAS